MLLRSGALGAILSLAAATAASAATVTYDLTGGSGQTALAEFSAGGVGLTVSALSVDQAGAVRSDSDSVVSLNADGLGALNRVSSADPEKNVFVDGNSPRGFNDLLVFQFSQAVASVAVSFVERAGFEASQFTLYAAASGGGLASAGAPSDVDGTTSFDFVLDSFGLAALENSDQFLVSSVSFDDGSVAPIPVPAAGLLLLGGLGGLALARRRRA